MSWIRSEELGKVLGMPGAQHLQARYREIGDSNPALWMMVAAFIAFFNTPRMLKAPAPGKAAA